ncbi:MAG: hypothetical protein M0Z88_02785 [Actinomycetota bacterium]|nr:hypothetical protein [Actinomycetota bacterium]
MGGVSMLGIFHAQGSQTAEGSPLASSYEHGLHFLVGAELAMAVTLAACMAISYGTAASTYGVSYYGVHFDTLWIIAVGFLATSYLLFRSAAAIDRDGAPAMVLLSLKVLAIGLVALLVTPYTVDTFFNWTHMIIGTTVFGVQMAVGVVLAFKVLGDRLGWIGVAIQFAGGVIAALSLPDHMLNYMLQGEIVFQVGFAILLNHLFVSAIRRHAAEPG